jgi:4-hydroxy-2-oxoheptanedioate aldolase
MESNRLKAKLFAGEPVFGVSIMFPSPQIIEIVGRLGFDWVLIDCEHGAISVESVELMALAAERVGITAIARPLSNNKQTIMQLMDRGISGVQIPHVNTVDDALRAVEAVKFYPDGDRGLAAGTRAANYGIGVSQDEHTERANRETLVCVQIEEQLALDNLDEILQVEGVDVFFVGPSDLSQSLGYPGQKSAPPVKKAIETALRKIAGAGKISGSAGDTDAIRGYLDQSVKYLYTHVPTLLSNSGKEFFEKVGQGKPL